jgi:hypothetical protein
MESNKDAAFLSLFYIYVESCRNQSNVYPGLHVSVSWAVSCIIPAPTMFFNFLVRIFNDIPRIFLLEIRLSSTSVFLYGQRNNE